MSPLIYIQLLSVKVAIMPDIIRRRLPLGYANIIIIYLISAELLAIMSAPCKKRGAQTEILGCRDSFIVESRRIKVRFPVRTSGGCTAWCGLIVQRPLLASKRPYIPHSNRVVMTVRRLALLHSSPSAPHRRSAAAAGATLCARFGRHCGDGSLSASNIPPPVRRRGGHYQISFVIKANRLLCDIRSHICLYELRR